MLRNLGWCVVLDSEPASHSSVLCLRSARCQFSTFEQCQEWLKRLSTVVRPPSRLEDLFSFAFHAWCMNVYAGEKEQHSELCRPGTSSPPPPRLRHAAGPSAHLRGFYVLLLSFCR